MLTRLLIAALALCLCMTKPAAAVDEHALESLYGDWVVADKLWWLTKNPHGNYGRGSEDPIGMGEFADSSSTASLSVSVYEKSNTEKKGLGLYSYTAFFDGQRLMLYRWIRAPKDHKKRREGTKTIYDPYVTNEWIDLTLSADSNSLSGNVWHQKFTHINDGRCYFGGCDESKWEMLQAGSITANRVASTAEKKPIEKQAAKKEPEEEDKKLKAQGADSDVRL